MNSITHATQDQLSKIRRFPGYKLTIFNSAFENPFFKDATDFLRKSYRLLSQSEEFENDTFLVLKIAFEDRSIALRVSCDYYTATCTNKKNETKTIAMWQGSSQFSGYSMDDLEYYLVNSCLRKTGPVVLNPNIRELLSISLPSVVCNVTVQLVLAKQGSEASTSLVYKQVCNIIDSYSGKTSFEEHVHNCIFSGVPKRCGTLALFTENKADHLK